MPEFSTGHLQSTVSGFSILFDGGIDRESRLQWVQYGRTDSKEVDTTVGGGGHQTL